MQVSRDIDQRLVARGTKIHDVVADPGSKVWKLVYAKFFPSGNGEGEAGGRRNAYVEAIDENGVQLANILFRFSWPSGSAPLLTNGRTGFDAGNQPFSPGENAFSISKEDGDTVEGIGMGQMTPSGFNPGEHTATLLRYQRMTESGVQQPGDGGPEIPPVEPGDKTIISFQMMLRYSDGTTESIVRP